MNTTPQKPVLTRHPLVNIAEWRKGCSCAPKDHPVQCGDCTEGLIAAVENWFAQHRSAYPFDIANILANLDERSKEYDKPVVASEAAKLIRTFEADLYAAQDQVAGLQELMANQGMPAHLDHAVRFLVASANADGDTTGVGSPAHGHNIRGLWDGDSQHKKGSVCRECAAWDALRHYASVDIGAVQQVSREVELHAALVKAQKVIDMLFPGVSKIFGVDFQELNESCAAVSQALKVKPQGAMAPEAKLTLPQFHEGKVDLVVRLHLVPAGVRVVQGVRDLGINWLSYHSDTNPHRILFKGCTRVPVVLPSWLEVVE